MIKKIIAFLFLPMLIVSLFLSFAGVTYIDPTSSVFMDFFRSISFRYNEFNFTIPNIPSIPDIESSSSSKPFELITALIWIGNLLVKFFNGVIAVVNIVILILNVVIKVIEFVIAFVWAIVDFIKGVPVIPRPEQIILNSLVF